MTAYPKVSVFVEATDRTVSLIEERFDIAIRAQPMVEDVAGRPENPADLSNFATVASSDDTFDRGARWNLTNVDNQVQQIELKPRLVTSDLRVRLQAAILKPDADCCL
ncbi:MAG: hypothetical protein WCC87_12890 [Candidatus Korobacteraceae bacterium]